MNHKLCLFLASPSPHNLGTLCPPCSLNIPSLALPTPKSFVWLTVASWRKELLPREPPRKGWRPALHTKPGAPETQGAVDH